MIEWHTDELRPKHDTILTVEPQKVIVTHDYFQQGDLLMFAGSGCRGYVVLPPVKRANGHTELSIATKYVREITQRTIGWETIWVDSPGMTGRCAARRSASASREFRSWIGRRVLTAPRLSAEPSTRPSRGAWRSAGTAPSAVPVTPPSLSTTAGLESAGLTLLRTRRLDGIVAGQQRCIE